MSNIVLNFLFTLLIFSSTQLLAQEFGVASYYSDDFHGRLTSSNESYDKNKLTASHKTIPFGTYLRVTDVDTNKSVVVRVNDRGPFIKGRVVEVSRKAAEKLGILNAGEANVKIEVVDRPSREEEQITTKVKDVPKEYTPKSVEPVIETKVPKPAKPKSTTPKKKTEKPKPKAKTVAKKTSAKEDEAPGKLRKATSFRQHDLYQVQLFKPEKRGYGVQVASVSSYDGAMKVITSLQKKWFDNILLSIEPGDDGKDHFKIILGPFKKRDEANSYKRHLSKKKKINGFVVDLSAIDY